MGDPSKYVEPVTDLETGEEIVAPVAAVDPSASVSMTQAEFAAAMGAAIAKGVSEGMAANAPIKKMTFGEYIRTAHSPFHPDGRAAIPKAARQYYQNGVMIPLELTHDDELRLYNRITHSGRYIDRMVEVIVNTDSAEETVDIRWHNAELDQRFEMKGKARNFLDMLQQIVTAQEAEDKTQAQREEGRARSRTFGSNKTSQAAREAAVANA